MDLGVCQPPILLHGDVVDFLSRLHDADKEELVSPCPGIGIIAESETAELPEVGNLCDFPCLLGHALNGIAEEQPDTGDGVDDDVEQEVVDNVPRQTDETFGQADEPSLTGILIDCEQDTHQHPDTQSAHKIVNHLNHFLSSFG